MPLGDERASFTPDLFAAGEREPLLPAPTMLCIVEAMRLWGRDRVTVEGDTIRIDSAIAKILVDSGCLRVTRHGQRGNFAFKGVLTRLPA